MRAEPVFIGLLLVAGSAFAEVKLDEAWLRPAYAGQPSALVYVDIHATKAMKLVAASSPVAKRAELVLVDPPGTDAAAHKVVRDLPVTANATTRLAYLASHVRLLEIGRDLKPGDSVPVTLTFVGADGKRLSATTEARVRGIGVRRPADGKINQQ